MEPYFIKADVPFNDEKENSNAGKTAPVFLSQLHIQNSGKTTA
jgi:hypothetical protein